MVQVNNNMVQVNYINNHHQIELDKTIDRIQQTITKEKVPFLLPFIFI